jgi:hypothetical protein
MSRFANLEFELPALPIAGAPPTEELPERDEHYFHALGVSAWLAGDFEEALLNFSRSLGERSAFYEGWFGQLRMLLELAEHREARLWSDQALKLFSGHHELLSIAALAALRDGQVKRARELADQALERPDPTWYVWLARAEVLQPHRGGILEACLRNAAAAAGPDVHVERLEAGRLLMRCGQPAAALEWLAPAAAAMPVSALALYELGRCQAALSLPDAAVTLRHCLVLRPAWREANTALRQAAERRLRFSWFSRRT